MYTIRVYGIYVKDGKVLLSNEQYSEKQMLKFPGGGLEYGEGTIECLARELKEEYNLELASAKHYYTTDFFVPSAFHNKTGVMSIYYLIDFKNKNIPVNQVFKDHEATRVLEWATLSEFDPLLLTFPIDQKVGSMLLT